MAIDSSGKVGPLEFGAYRNEKFDPGSRENGMSAAHFTSLAARLTHASRMLLPSPALGPRNVIPVFSIHSASTSLGEIRTNLRRPGTSDRECRSPLHG